TFTISRKDAASLSGTYAASANGQFLVENNLLNSSLVVTNTLDTSSGTTLGFTFAGDLGLRFTSSGGTGAGTLQKVDLTSGAGIRPTKITEAPIAPPVGFSFIRTLAPLSNGSAIIGLTQSGFTILPPDYDAPTLEPRIDNIVNSADNTRPVAPGGLISVIGGNISSVSVSSREIPLPTVLGEACFEVNGDMIPLLLASPGRLNAQLPFKTAVGNNRVVLRTPGGITNATLNVLPTAPAVFRSGTAGGETGIPLITRVANNLLVTLSNPVHKGDDLVIYATGLGQTSPVVESGVPAPSDPLAGVSFDPAVVLGHIELPVTYAGLAPGEIGVYQINVKVPHSAPQGLAIPMTILQSSGVTTLSVRVVD
ncbi:MAG: hypothetical protein ACRD8O_16540, partial [Bryobacteraceae bacterium]